jgi:hypothetical protein
MCERWQKSLAAFVEDMGPRRNLKRYLTRRDSAGDYTPKNCYWGTKEEALSLPSSFITARGKRQSLKAWANELGISRQAMEMRVNKCLVLGISTKHAVTSPVRPRSKMLLPIK